MNDQSSRRHRRRRFVIALAGMSSLGTLAATAVAVTNGLFSDTATSSSNSLTSGTVTVGAGTGTTVTCAVTGIVPGDSSTGDASGSKALAECAYSVKYTGSAPAYLGVDVSVTDGTTKLYSADANGLQWLVKDASNTYVSGYQYSDQASATQTLTSGTPLTNLLLSTAPAATNHEVLFKVDYLLPASAGNAYQGGQASISLTFHAVQSGNQTLPAACGAGRQCSGLTWS
jgi:hypothetical protein